MGKNGGKLLTAVKTVEDRFHEEEMEKKLQDLDNEDEYVITGETLIEDEVIGAMAAEAAREIAGVSDIGTSSIRRTLMERIGGHEKRARGVAVEAGRKEAIIDLALRVVYGFNIPELIIDVRKRVAARLLELCGLITKEINIHVVGVDFPDRMPGRVE
jgi:uncharacterized alkaline shock family protein YloU